MKTKAAQRSAAGRGSAQADSPTAPVASTPAPRIISSLVAIWISNLSGKNRVMALCWQLCQLQADLADAIIAGLHGNLPERARRRLDDLTAEGKVPDTSSPGRVTMLSELIRDGRLTISEWFQIFTAAQALASGELRAVLAAFAHTSGHSGLSASNKVLLSVYICKADPDAMAEFIRLADLPIVEGQELAQAEQFFQGNKSVITSRCFAVQAKLAQS